MKEVIKKEFSKRYEILDEENKKVPNLKRQYILLKASLNSDVFLDPDFYSSADCWEANIDLKCLKIDPFSLSDEESRTRNKIVDLDEQQKRNIFKLYEIKNDFWINHYIFKDLLKGLRDICLISKLPEDEIIGKLVINFEKIIEAVRSLSVSIRYLPNILRWNANEKRKFFLKEIKNTKEFLSNIEIFVHYLKSRNQLEKISFILKDKDNKLKWYLKKLITTELDVSKLSVPTFKKISFSEYIKKVKAGITNCLFDFSFKEEIDGKIKIIPSVKIQSWRDEIKVCLSAKTDIIEILKIMIPDAVVVGDDKDFINLCVQLVRIFHPEQHEKLLKKLFERYKGSFFERKVKEWFEHSQESQIMTIFWNKNGIQRMLPDTDFTPEQKNLLLAFSGAFLSPYNSSNFDEVSSIWEVLILKHGDLLSKIIDVREYKYLKEILIANKFEWFEDPNHVDVQSSGTQHIWYHKELPISIRIKKSGQFSIRLDIAKLDSLQIGKDLIDLIVHSKN